MALTRRGDLNRPLTIEELDGNFDYLEGLSSESTDSRGYRVYTALVSQEATSNPTLVYVQENTFIGATLSMTRLDIGEYNCVFNIGTINSNKVNIKIGQSINIYFGGDNFINGVNINTNQITFKIRTTSSASTYSDFQLNVTQLEIKIYN